MGLGKGITAEKKMCMEKNKNGKKKNGVINADLNRTSPLPPYSLKSERVGEKKYSKCTICTPT